MNTHPWHILVVDDDPQICDLLSQYLKQHNFRITTAKNGQDMWNKFKQHTFNLVILDIMMPGDDGLTLCRKLRETSDVAIIMLSAVGDEADRIIGLEVGADDYLAKPFSPRELLARIKALIRRSSGALGQRRQTTEQLAQQPNIQFNGWTLNKNKRQLMTADNMTVPLSAAEYELLIAFLEHPQRILTRDQLLDITKGRQAIPFDRTIDVQVARLRKKIEKDPKNPTIIITVRGGGYQFTARVSAEQ